MVPYRYNRRWLCLLAPLLAAVSMPAWGAECWQGWGYMVEAKTLAYKSGQSLYVTNGPADWQSRKWIRLYPIDQATGRRITNKKPLYIRPTNPTRVGSGAWSKEIEDVAQVKGSKLSLMLRFSHILPPPNARTLNDNFSRWACGLGDAKPAPRR